MRSRFTWRGSRSRVAIGTTEGGHPRRRSPEIGFQDKLRRYPGQWPAERAGRSLIAGGPEPRRRRAPAPIPLRDRLRRRNGPRRRIAPGAALLPGERGLQGLDQELDLGGPGVSPGPGPRPGRGRGGRPRAGRRRSRCRRGYSRSSRAGLRGYGAPCTRSPGGTPGGPHPADPAGAGSRPGCS